MRESDAGRHGGAGARTRAALAALVLLAITPGAVRADAEAARHGLVPLPCSDGGPLRPVTRAYCLGSRHYVTLSARDALAQAAEVAARAYPGAVVRYMEASWPSGLRPMPPHLSHGDGREVDLALFWETHRGRPLSIPPTPSGYGAFEPPRRESERVCRGVRGVHTEPDPPPSRPWRLDATRTAALVRILSADPRVRRIFLEPHLKVRLGFGRDPKVRFAGCNAARHDDHIHVDFR